MSEDREKELAVHEGDHYGAFSFHMPRCPWCGHGVEEWWDGCGFREDGDEAEIECGKCEQAYIARFETSVSFTAWRKPPHPAKEGERE